MMTELHHYSRDPPIVRHQHIITKGQFTHSLFHIALNTSIAFIGHVIIKSIVKSIVIAAIVIATIAGIIGRIFTKEKSGIAVIHTRCEIGLIFYIES